MAVQTSYGFGFPKGVAGGLYDLSAHEIATRQAENKVTFGVGVVVGSQKGIDVMLPTASSTADEFEGVMVHNSIMTELDINNKLMIADKRTVGCLTFGRLWVKIGENAEPEYKERIYLITDGEEVGMFTTETDPSTKIKLDGYFLGIMDTGLAVAMFHYPGTLKKD